MMHIFPKRSKVLKTRLMILLISYLIMFLVWKSDSGKFLNDGTTDIPNYSLGSFT